tara:strand:- start:698 stop:934 length:237 start_codon:yes stop_codon:yes gene_type:complete
MKINRLKLSDGGVGSKKKTKKVTVKGVDISGLNTRQQNLMKDHSVHHTKKHMKMMATMMKNGKTFTESHKAAQKKVGT